MYGIPRNLATTFNDLDSIGATEDKLFLVESIASSGTSTKTSGEYSPSDANPMTVLAPSCPVGSELNDMYMDVGDMVWVFKWDFTNSN